MALDPLFQQALTQFSQELASMRRQIKTLQYAARQSQLGQSSLDNGTLTVTSQGQTRTMIGLQSDGTVTVVDQNAPAPPTPDTPVVAVIVNGLSVSWDGGFVNGAAQPLDFRDIEVHVSTVSGFTPSSLTLEAVLLKAGTAQVVPLSPDQTYYVIIRAVNSSGEPSTPSPQVAIKYNTSLQVGAVATQGALTGVSIVNPTIVGAIIQAAALSNSSITQAAITQGSILEADFVMDSTGGRIRGYGTTTTTVSYTTPGTYPWTCPAGVYAVKVECEGSDAGGGGGNSSSGGEGGGGAEYAQEPAYPVVPGNVYTIIVPAGGQGASTGNAGSSGQQASFDGSGVVAGGGLAGADFVGGPGGNISGNTIHWPGGEGGSNPSFFSGAAGGGGRAGSTGPGGNGNNPTGSSGASGGAAGTGTGGLAGGAGGGSQAPGSNGGGGGGAGNAPGGSGAYTFDPTFTQSYYGSGSLRNTNGDLYQNYSSGNPGGDGDQFAYWWYDASQIASLLSGKTITGCNFNAQNLHSWYDSGGYGVFGYSIQSGIIHAGQVVQWFAEGGSANVNLGSGIGAAFAANDGQVVVALGPAGSVGQTGNQYYYGYWNTNSGALTIYYATVGSETAGNGSNGSVKLTYTNAGTPVVAVAGSAGTEPVSSDTYGPGVTLWPQSSPPAAVTGGLLYGASAGGPAAVLPSGFAGYIPVTATDTTQITVTTPTVSALSKLWPIPAGDAKAGTKYTLEVWGSGENESNDPWAPIFVLGGSSYYIVNVPTGSDWVSGLLSGWKAQFQFTVISTGTSGVVIAAGRFEVGEPGTSSNTYFSWYSGGTLNMDTTIANSFNLDWRWWSVPGSPTITSYASSLERVGP